MSGQLSSTSCIKDGSCALLSLPLTAIENILGHLGYIDLFRFRCTCRYINSLCAYKIRNDFKNIKKMIRMELSRADDKSRAILNIKDRERNLKYKYILRILDVEISLILIVCRQILQNENMCFSLGELMNDFRMILNKVQARSIASWGDMKHCSKLIQRKVSFYLNNLNATYLPPAFMGILMIDLLDITMNCKFVVKVTYDTQAQACSVAAKYQVDNVKILNFLPDLSTVDCCNQPVTSEENTLITNFFALMIRIHNYFIIQDKHYQERIKIYHSQHIREHVNATFNNFNGTKNTRFITERKVISDYEIEEIYRNISGVLKYTGKGLWFEINLQCPINDAPLQILKNWERLINEMGKKMSDSNSEINTLNSYTIFIKFKKYLSDNMNCIHIKQA